MFFNEKVAAARYYAIEIHGNQKYDEFPYIKHAEDVFKVLLDFDIKDIELLEGGYLHDAIEDGATSYQKLKKKFGENVAELVYGVTDELGRNRRERHLKTYPKTRKKLKTIILKVADRIANVRFSKGNQAKTSLFEMYKKEHEELRKELDTEHITLRAEEFELNEKLNKMWKHLNSLLE